MNHYKLNIKRKNKLVFKQSFYDSHKKYEYLIIIFNMNFYKSFYKYIVLCK